MKVNLLPKTQLGKWSVWLILIMPILFFVGFLLTNSLYQSVSSGKSILQDIAQRPLLALTMLTGMVCGIGAFITGFLAIYQQKERAILVYISTLLGFFLIIFLAGEVLFPH